MNNMSVILPPEWAEQRFVQLTWPHEDTDWAYMLDEVNTCFTDIARQVSEREDLLIVCRSEKRTRELLKEINQSRIKYVELPSNDTWARDHGGITVFKHGKRTVLDFTFNGWGMKFAANFDNMLTRQLLEESIFGEASYENCLDFVLEGGSVESDGEGTLLTTAECLLSDNRNNRSKEEIKLILKERLGAERILWLHHGYLAGDDTDSHVDTLARFCTPDIIAYVQCTDEDDEHYEELKKMEGELKAFRMSDGKPYNLLPLPMADVVYDEDGERLPATYANFLIMNGAVLLPFYNSEKDEIAREQLQKAFPDREIVGVNCLPLIKQHGSLHCVTMQYP
ncbi:agmatine deiminase family protein [Paludibacter sp. 221]|uniref:agmatine deiminase family protein n=1 Tax=Paludibacter sp. 221 TaxID=2302939 RepID=UPI0013D15A06|nr:agmatine deiminase family protein [Paludibacter sp. 221]NDV45906.1 agmatine deiminase family protein [Paludibacter sp. 221]